MMDPQGPSGGGPLGDIPYLRLPRPEALFARRAERLAELSPGHTLSEFLELLSRIAKAQLAAWETVCAGRASTPARDAGLRSARTGEERTARTGEERTARTEKEQSVRPERSAGGAESKGARTARTEEERTVRTEDERPVRPERSAGGAESKGERTVRTGEERTARPEDEPSVRPERSAGGAESKGALAGTWHEALQVMVTELSARAIPAESRAALDRLARASADELDALAARVLENAAAGTDLSAGPFVAAALQVEHADRASRVDPATVARAESGCPVCGSLPMVGVVLGDDRLRYLVCSLCATQWHHTRIQCTVCRGAEGLAYYALEGERAASVPVMESVKAEACPRCKAYTKLLYLEKDPRIEPFADDVATLALDLLMAEGGWARHGVNLFLLAPPDGGS